MSRQSEIDKIAEAIPYRGTIRCNKTIRTALATALVDNGIGTKDRFEIEYFVCNEFAIKPIDYKDKDEK